MVVPGGQRIIHLSFRCVYALSDGVPHVDPHIDHDADDDDALMQLQRTFFESISDSSIVVVGTRGRFNSPAKEDGERDSEQMYSHAAKQRFR